LQLLLVVKDEDDVDYDLFNKTFAVELVIKLEDDNEDVNEDVIAVF
jgi:hypothetical protein